MNSHWRKIGRIFNPESELRHPKLVSHAANPLAILINDDTYRVYFSGRDHKNRSLNFAYSKLGIPKELIRADHQRGIYFSPLYNNTTDYLRKEISENDLVKSFDTSEETLANIWKTKYAKGRISMLKKKNNVSTESLFYDDLIFMSWEETKEKYLPQVGR